jgi:hypothetical protein
MNFWTHVMAPEQLPLFKRLSVDIESDMPDVHQLCYRESQRKRNTRARVTNRKQCCRATRDQTSLSSESPVVFETLSTAFQSALHKQWGLVAK